MRLAHRICTEHSSAWEQNVFIGNQRKPSNNEGQTPLNRNISSAPLYLSDKVS